MESSEHSAVRSSFDKNMPRGVRCHDYAPLPSQLGPPMKSILLLSAVLASPCLLRGATILEALVLISVPEPSTLLLSVFAACSLMRRRRRNTITCSPPPDSKRSKSNLDDDDHEAGSRASLPKWSCRWRNSIRQRRCGVVAASSTPEWTKRRTFKRVWPRGASPPCAISTNQQLSAPHVRSHSQAPSNQVVHPENWPGTRAPLRSQTSLFTRRGASRGP